MSNTIHKSPLLKVVLLANLDIKCVQILTNSDQTLLCYIFRLYIFNLPNVTVDSDFSTIFVSFIFQRALYKVQKF